MSEFPGSAHGGGDLVIDSDRCISSCLNLGKGGQLKCVIKPQGVNC